jgi:hypothetical protein
MHDRHAVMVEETETLATTAKKRFRDIILGEDAIKERFDLDASREARKERNTFIETELELVNANPVKSLEEWIEERKALHEKIKRIEKEYEKLKEDREKLIDQVSAH